MQRVMFQLKTSINVLVLLFLFDQILFTSAVSAASISSTLPVTLLQAAHAPRALYQSALLTEKATHSVLLSVTRAGTRLVAAGERGIILISDDQGLSWQQSVVPTSVNITKLYFVDAMQGWALGHMGVVLHTMDGGDTWSKQLDGIELAKLAVEAVRDTEDDRIRKKAINLLKDGPDKPFFDITMDAQGRGFVVGAFNLIFRTEDGGKQWHYWSPQLENPLDLHLYSIAQVGKRYLIVGEQGLIMRSTLKGDRFEAVSSPYGGSWFGFLISRQGTLLLYGLRGNAYVSSDQGDTWHAVSVSSDVSFSSATELEDGRIILVNQAGELFVSHDQGQHFSTIPRGLRAPLTAVVQSESGNLVLTSLLGIKVLSDFDSP
ncbi:MAG: YCF48-related protein [Gammaproteobacteria bacterium]